MGDPQSSQKTNYHSILNISNTASLSDISKPNKLLVNKWHPDKQHFNIDEAQAHFRKITEANTVLNNLKREESGLLVYNNEPKKPKALNVSFQEENKDDIHISSPKFLPKSASKKPIERNESHHTPVKGSKSKKNKTPTPEDFYGSLPKSTTETFIPRSPSLSRVGTQRNGSTPIIYSQSTARRKPRPIEKKLECTLKELWHGCVKKVKITRGAITENGLIVQEEEILKIRVKPGWKNKTKITFEGKGDEKPGSLPADIIFVIDEKRHATFKRDGDDLQLEVEVPLIQALTGCTITVPLLLEVEVPLIQALTGCTITVPLLGGEEMTLSFDEILYPGYEMIIQGQGMPKSKEEGNKGDLQLRFLEFPRELSDEQRTDVKSILNECL